jgi:hypothetical protein
MPAVVALPATPEVVVRPPPALVESLASPEVPVDEFVPPMPLLVPVAPSVLSEAVPVLLVAPEPTAPPVVPDPVVPVVPGATPELVVVSLVVVEASAPVESPLLDPSGSEGPQAAATARKPINIELAKTRTAPPRSLSNHLSFAMDSMTSTAPVRGTKFDEAMFSWAFRRAA